MHSKTLRVDRDFTDVKVFKLGAINFPFSESF